MRTLLTVATVFGFAVSEARAQSQTQLPGLLSNLPPTAVEIRLRDESEGLDASDLRTLVELKLRQNRIVVIPEGDSVTYPRSTAIVEMLSRWDIAHSMRYYTYSLQVVELTTLTRTHRIAYGIVWRSGPTLADTGANLDYPARVREKVAQMVEGFVNDYLAANPGH